jgi:predicted NAD-dependent protein-ADP-ribosyltransferase YbiA (DUF1768 family)
VNTDNYETGETYNTEIYSSWRRKGYKQSLDKAERILAAHKPDEAKILGALKELNPKLLEELLFARVGKGSSSGK